MAERSVHPANRPFQDSPLRQPEQVDVAKDARVQHALTVRRGSAVPARNLSDRGSDRRTSILHTERPYREEAIRAAKPGTDRISQQLVAPARKRITQPQPKKK